MMMMRMIVMIMMMVMMVTMMMMMMMLKLQYLSKSSRKVESSGPLASHPGAILDSETMEAK